MTDPAELDQLFFYHAVIEGFQRAATAHGTLDRHYLIGGRRIALRFAGEGLLPAVTPGIEHNEVAAEGKPDLLIRLFDNQSTGSTMPVLLAPYLEQVRHHWWEYLGSRRELLGMDGERVRCAFHPGPDILSVLDTHTSEAIYWVPDAARIPYYETGYPLSVILNWWLAPQDLHFAHAACIGNESGSVLLTARGGSGKSTTTLACVNSGLGLTADDYSLIDSEQLVVHSLYNTVKLKALSDVERFDGLSACVANLEYVDDSEEDGERPLIYLQQYFPDQILRSSPLRAILVPEIVRRKSTRITSIGAGEAFKAIMPSTVFQLPGDARRCFSAMARLTRRVPCYRIELGSDIPAIPGVIDQFLQGPPA